MSSASPVSLEDQIKHVVYEMLILAMSIRYLRANWPDDVGNSMFGPKQVAKEAALIKIRSLDLFLHGDANGKWSKDDIRFDEFHAAGLTTGPKGTPIPQDFRKSVNKYVAHLTKERTLRDVCRPKADDVVAYGPLILESCKLFVEEWKTNGLALEGRSGEYYAAFLEEEGKVAAL
jgi:hypothetical protein